ncbi:RNA-directed DNA polymerase from mobile element jockey [Eumeta japonica]|uniref:RNA-directed DNA polymerase from mobile element jockey n=1 Tax=Eumeta variegata TaxID=151549 RepID=A0A4C1ZNJ8_EUMVA|nr:RNA-directed DNA polymerase from mobile element jockey [Eumeta japonica]
MRACEEEQFTPHPASDLHAVIADQEEERRVREFLSTPIPPLPGEYYVSPAETARTILRLPKRKAPGPDGIPTIAIKQLPRRAMVAITRLFKGILWTGHFPGSWKMGRVIAIPKAGKDPQLASSQRPITLLSHIAKLFERIVLRRLHSHLTPRREQFGFRNRHSITLQLARVLLDIATEPNGGRRTVGIFLVIEKAFDRVWHSGLLYKLTNIQIPPELVWTVTSFLEGHNFYVTVEDATSDPRPIRAGYHKAAAYRHACMRYKMMTYSPCRPIARLGGRCRVGTICSCTSTAIHEARLKYRSLDRLKTLSIICPPHRKKSVL